MNLLLLRPEELSPDGTAVLTGRRLLHAKEVLQVGKGDALRVGLLGGLRGEAEVLSLDAAALTLRVKLAEPPPARAGVDLLLAMPRPKALKKIVPAVASFGVSRLFLINASRVEKSFFASPFVRPAALEELLCLGLEQARDTLLPEVRVVERFKPFVEDELDGLLGPGPLRLLAHPGVAPLGARLRAEPRRQVALAIGPDGGWVPFERELLGQHGFHEVSLGERPLRTEVAVSALLGALAAWS
jgi:RsmE family RNA methyltransferase